jgi:hypothetical protein
MVSIENVRDALYKSWSLESSSKWTRENPANGQCGVTSLVVNDLLGGEIVKTKCVGGWHFYNKLNGICYDFTEKINFQKQLNIRIFLLVGKKPLQIQIYNNITH